MLPEVFSIEEGMSCWHESTLWTIFVEKLLHVRRAAVSYKKEKKEKFKRSHFYWIFIGVFAVSCNLSIFSFKKKLNNWKECEKKYNEKKKLIKTVRYFWSGYSVYGGITDRSDCGMFCDKCFGHSASWLQYSFSYISYRKIYIAVLFLSVF